MTASQKKHTRDKREIDVWQYYKKEYFSRRTP